MKSKIVVALLVMLGFACAASGAVIWEDNFDSYANQAALDAVYTQAYPTDVLDLDQTRGNSDGQSVTPGVNANYTNKMWKNLGAELVGSDAQPIKLEVMIDMDIATNWHTREYIELRAYDAGGYLEGGLGGIVALGATSSGVDTTKYNARFLYGGGAGWVSTSIAKMTGWHKLTALIKSTTVEVYVDDVLGYSGNGGGGISYDSIVIGSGLSTATQVWFDDLSVSQIPEPATASLFALASTVLLRRRR